MAGGGEQEQRQPCGGGHLARERERHACVGTQRRPACDVASCSTGLPLVSFLKVLKQIPIGGAKPPHPPYLPVPQTQPASRLSPPAPAGPPCAPVTPPLPLPLPPFPGCRAA